MRVAADQELRREVVADRKLARAQVVEDRRLVAAAEPQHRYGGLDLDTERAHPFHRRLEAVDQLRGELRVAVGDRLAQRLVGRRGPDEARTGGTPAELALLDERDRAAVPHRPGGGRQPGHPTAEHE